MERIGTEYYYLFVTEKNLIVGHWFWKKFMTFSVRLTSIAHLIKIIIKTKFYYVIISLFEYFKHW